MAEKLTGKGKTLDDKKAADKNHNAFKIDRKEAKDFFDRLDSRRNDFESQRGEYMADQKALYEDASEKLGIPRKIVRKVYGEHVRAMRDQAAEAEMEPSEKDAADKLRLALGQFKDMPLAIAAIEKAERAEAAHQMEMAAPAGNA